MIKSGSSLLAKWLSLALLLSSSIAIAQSGIEGLWNTGEDNTQITIQKDETELVGKIKSSDNDKAVIGKVILKKLKKEGDRWKGQLFAAKRQKWFDADLKPKETTMDLIISVGIYKKKVEWTRVIE